MITNPFMHDAAAGIKNEDLAKIFIDNDNSRIIDTNQNVFINGYRGAGKSMLMRYHSFPIKNIIKENDFERIGIYVECRNPYFAKMDAYFSNNEFHVAIIFEHILVLSMASSLLKTIITINNNNNLENLEDLKKELEYYFDTFGATSQATVLQEFYDWLNKQTYDLQVELMKAPEEFIKTKTYSYLSLIDAIINIFKKISLLKTTHFMFLMDDAILLNEQQQKTINTWISYRDTTNVSFKVAITSADEYSFLTGNGSVILENHDYIMLDLEENFFSGNTEFYRFAKRVIEKRFEVFNINVSANEFFPESKEFKKQLATIEKKFIEGDYPEKSDHSKQQRKDNVSKYKRAIYFRENHEKPKANLPELPYTGFDVLTNISTGVIRNLLVPCHKMYEIEHEKNSLSSSITKISTIVQYQALKSESEKAWSNIDNLPSIIDNCTNTEAQELKNILTNFGKYLKEKLLDTTSSEKRILTFTIEDLNKPSDKIIKDEIKRIINIGIQSGLLYTRLGADHNGGKTKFYTPNRILWVSRGLDPVGQNGRKSFPAQTFYKMMKDPDFNNKLHNSEQTELEL